MASQALIDTELLQSVGKKFDSSCLELLEFIKLKHYILLEFVGSAAKDNLFVLFTCLAILCH